MSETAFPGCVPELTDGHVVLRAHSPDDVAAVVEQCTDPEMVRWTTVPSPYDADLARRFLADIERAWADPDGIRYWALAAADDPHRRFRGTIDLRPQAARDVVEVGFGLHPDARGQGLMASALRLAAQWWFDEGGSRVQWRAVRGNFPSWRVAWACGFTHHGILPGSHPPTEGDGPAADTWLASLGADDVMEARTPWADPPVLETSGGGGLRLRPWRDEDVEALEPRDQPVHHMPVRAVLDADTFPAWLLARREKMSVGTALSWCVADAATDTALGESIVFTPEGTLDDDTAEVGYQVVPSARRRGVATAATRLAVEHALTPRTEGGLGLRRLVAQTAEDNTGSNRVLDALGFGIWGRETAVDVLPGGRTVDALHWELLRD